MPNPPKLSAPDFGAWLTTLWEGKSDEQIAQRLRPHAEGLKLDRSSIPKWKQGRIPNWVIAHAISAAFEIPLLEVLGRLASAMGYAVPPGQHQHTSEMPRPTTRPHGHDQTAHERPRDERRKDAINAGVLKAQGLEDEVIDTITRLLDFLVAKRAAEGRTIEPRRRTRTGKTSSARRSGS